MNNSTMLSNIRREFGHLTLDETTVAHSPIEQFEYWFSEILKAKQEDPTAMTLSTVDKNGYPDSRIVLLKGLDDGEFVFYTNYTSQKSIQIENNPQVALNFYWPCLARQIRIRGQVKRVSSAQSDAYFASRPRASQLSAIISPQSKEVPNREMLEQELNQSKINQDQETIKRPSYWGGFSVKPWEVEFWQGRDCRLHDRIQYYLEHDQWRHHRLAP